MKTGRKILSLLLTMVLLLGFVSVGVISMQAKAAYENSPSSYNYPLRTIAQNGRGFTSSHKGIDFTIGKGTAVYAAKSGTVEIVYSGCKNYNGAASSGQDCESKGCTQSKVYMNGSGYKAGYYCNNGFGNGVVVKNDDGKFCYYAHLNTVSVKKGDKVTPSTKLGEVGSSGCSTGAHLHFSISSKSVGGTSYNPFNYIFPGFKIALTNNGSSSVNPRFSIYFPWKEFSATKCQISFGTSSSSLSKTSSDSNFTTSNCFYDLGSKFGNLTKGKTYYVKVTITKDGTTYNSSVYSFVAGAGDKTFLNYSTVASSNITVTFNGNGGTSSATSKSYTVGNTYGSSMPTATRSGYTFDGWYTAATGGSKITSSTTVTSGNKTFYAHWICNHSSTEMRNAKTATCTVEGYTGDTYCKTCGTKTKTGTTISKTDHNSNVSIPAIAATCQITGLTEGKKCSVCGTVTVAQQTVAIKAHADINSDGKCDSCSKDLGTVKPSEPENPTKNCSCNCHKGGIAGFFFKIILFFQKLFRANQICKCGIAHY